MQTESRSQKIAVTGATGRVGAPLVDILEQRGYHVVPISRSKGVDVVSDHDLAQALTGVETIIDTATGPRPIRSRQQLSLPRRHATCSEPAPRPARSGSWSFRSSASIVVVSIIGIDTFQGGYNAAKLSQERTLLEGPLPVRIVRAAQFHEFVEPLVG